MKLPTLNVDVAVNTSTLKKDVERANKQLSGIGSKGLAFAGGTFGKLGAFSGVGGGLGGAALGIGAGGLAIAAPFMIAGKIVDNFAATMKTAEQTLQEFSASGKTTTGMLATQAASILQALQDGGMGRTGAGFFGGFGQGFAAGGAGGPVNESAEWLSRGATWLGTLLGGAIGGIGGGSAEDIIRQADLSVARTEEEARALFEPHELKRLEAIMTQFTKQQREATT